MPIDNSTKQCYSYFINNKEAKCMTGSRNFKQIGKVGMSSRVTSKISFKVPKSMINGQPTLSS